MVSGFLAEFRLKIRVYIIPYIPLLRGIIRYFTQITSALSERKKFLILFTNCLAMIVGDQAMIGLMLGSVNMQGSKV